jgi:hypothetical protein
MMKRFLSVAVLTGSLLVAVAQNSGTFSVSRFQFSTPSGWQNIPTSSPMRKAQLKVGEGKEAAEIVFFHFGPGNGGGTQANVDRWINQFQGGKEQAKPKVEEKTVNGKKITYVQAEGTFNSGMPGGPSTPMSGYALHGAILEDSSEGAVFIKMTGPKATVEKASADFRKLVESAAGSGK